MSKSLGNSLVIPAVLERVRGIELRYYLVSAHYRSHVEFSFEALDEAAVGFRRIEGFLDRAVAVLGERPEPGMLCAEFIAAMDDDLGTPAAVGAVFDVVREGNKLLAGGPSPALRGNVASVRAMLGVLGLDPADPAWGATSSVDGRERKALEELIESRLDARNHARSNRRFEEADRIRNELLHLGIVVSDGTNGPTWTLRSDSDAR